MVNHESSSSLVNWHGSGTIYGFIIIDLVVLFFQNAIAQLFTQLNKTEKVDRDLQTAPKLDEDANSISNKLEVK